MTIPGARLLIEQQPVRTPLPYGLLSVSQTPVDADDVHWRNGIIYEVGTCDEAEVVTGYCAPSQKDETETPTVRGALPFTVYTLPVCSPVGLTEQMHQERAVGALTSGEARAVEREFWTGAHGTTPHLASDTVIQGTGIEDNVLEQTAADVVVTGAGIVLALALLEEELGFCYGNEGVIHVPAALLTFMTANDLVRRDGQRLRSPNGHLIAAGAGYPGTGPSGGLTPGTRWMFATGAVWVRRSPIEYPSTRREGLDKSLNSVVVVAERTYVVGWDCCHLAAQVDLTGGT